MGFYRGLAAQIGGDSQWRVRKVLEEEGSQDIPLLSLWGSGLCQACCCYGFSTYDELSRCLPGQQEGYPDDVLAAGEGGREVLLLPRVGCDEVLLPEGLHPEGWPDCMAEWMRACEVVVETPQMRLWRCTRISR